MSEFGPSKAGSGAISPAALERARSYAKDVMRQGMPGAKVEEVLLAQGFDPATASAIVTEANRTKNDRRIASRRLMIVGAVTAGIGITLTAVTYKMAEGGGTYVVWSGLIILGAVQFVRGLSQSGGMD